MMISCLKGIREGRQMEERFESVFNCLAMFNYLPSKVAPEATLWAAVITETVEERSGLSPPVGTLQKGRV